MAYYERRPNESIAEYEIRKKRMNQEFQNALNEIKGGRYLSYQNSRFSPEQQAQIDSLISSNMRPRSSTPAPTVSAPPTNSGGSAYENLQNIYSELSATPSEVISPAERQRLENQYGEQLGAETQAVADQFRDPYSGIQSGRRTDIALGAAGEAARIPIDLQIQINEKNRQARLQKLQQMLGVAGQQAGFIDTSGADSAYNTARNELNFANMQNRAAGQRADLISDFRGTPSMSAGSGARTPTMSNGYNTMTRKRLTPVISTNLAGRSGRVTGGLRMRPFNQNLNRSFG